MKKQLTEMNIEWDDLLLKGHAVSSVDKQDCPHNMTALLLSLKEKEAQILSVSEDLQAKEKQLKEYKNLMRSTSNKAEARRELQLLAEENAKLLQEKSVLNKNNEFLIKENTSLKEKSTQDERNIANYKRNIQEITSSNRELQRVIEEKNKDILDVNSAKEDLKEKLKNIEEQHDILTDQMDDVTNQRDNLGFTLKEKETYLTEMKKQLGECTKQVVGLEMELENERRIKSNMEHELTHSKDRVEKLGEAKNELKSEIMEKEKEVRQLKLMESKAMKSNCSLEQDLIKRASEIQRLQLLYEEIETKYKTLQSDLQHTKEMLDEVEQVKDDLNVDSDILQERIKSLEKEVQKRENIVLKLQEDNRSIELSRDELKELKEALEEEIIKVKKEKEDIYEELQNVVNSSVEKKTLAETETLLSEQIRINKEISFDEQKKDEALSNLKKMFENFKEEWVEEKKQIINNTDKIKSQLNNERSISQSKMKDIKVLEQNNLDLTEKVDHLSVYLDKSKTHCKDLEQKLTYLQSDYESINQNMIEIKTQNGLLGQSFNEENTKSENLEQNLAEIKTKLAIYQRIEEKDKMIKASFQDEIQALREKNENLVNKLSDKNNRLLQAEATKGQLEVEVSNSMELQDEIQNCKERLMSVTSSFDLNSHKIEQLVADVAKKEKKIAEMESRLKNAMENDVRLKSLLKKSEDGSISREAYLVIKKQLDEKNVEVEVLSASIRDYEENLSIMNNKNKKTEQTKQELKITQEEVTEQLALLKTQHRGAQDELQQCQRRIKEITAEAIEKDEESKNTKKELNQKTSHINEVMEELQQVKMESAELKDESTENKQKLERVIKTNHELEIEKQELVQKSTYDMKNISSLKNNLERLERKKLAVETELENARETLSHEESKSKELRKQLSEALNRDHSQTELIENLGKDNDDLCLEIDKTHTKLKELRETLEAKEYELTTVSNECSIENRKSASMVNKLKLLENENYKNNSIITNIQTANEQLQQESRLAQNQISSYLTLISDLKDELADGKAKNRSRDQRKCKFS